MSYLIVGDDQGKWHVQEHVGVQFDPIAESMAYRCKMNEGETHDDIDSAVRSLKDKLKG